MIYHRFDTPKLSLSLTDAQTESYVAEAKKFYTPDYEYHNFDIHAQEVIDGVKTITSKLGRQGIVTPTNALIVAAAWHDAGYHEDHKALGFETKEAYSAYLLDQFLKEEQVSEYERLVMLSAINATTHNYQGRSAYDLILHRADTANIGGPAEKFIEKNILIFKELQHTHGPTPWDTHVRQSHGFIQSLVAEHGRESTDHAVEPSDTTIDVHDTPFALAALSNLRVLIRHPKVELLAA